MITLFDMLTGNQNNDIASHVAAQFGLQKQMAEKAIEALMPAFSEGLQRNVSTPQSFGTFMQALANGNHANYFSNPADVFNLSGVKEGEAILGHLFGTKSVSRNVAEQAALVSGVPSNILKQMLPALAPIIMGGLFNQMTGQLPGSGMQMQQAAASANPFGRILEELMKGGQSARNQHTNSGNPIGDILEQMMGRKSGQQTSQQGHKMQPSDGPLGKIFDEMLKGSKTAGNRGEGPLDRYERQYESGPGSSRDDPYAHEQMPSTPKAEPKGGLEDLFGEMLKPAKQMNQRYEESIESIFNEFLGPRKH